MNWRPSGVLLLGLLFAAPIPGGWSPAQEPDGGFEPRALGMSVPVLTSPRERESYVGRLVAVRGTVSDSKIPRIAGVRVAADDRLRGREAYAVGILARVKVTDEDLRRSEERAGGPLPNDGPGVKYVLYFSLAGRIAEARPISQKTEPPHGSPGPKRPKETAEVTMDQPANQKANPDQLSDDIPQRVIRDFGAEKADEIYRYLLDRIPAGLPNGTRPRHLRCILFLAKGDRGLLDEYIEMCLQDTRDVMLNAEYETDAKGRLVRLRDFSKPFDQAEIQRQKKGGEAGGQATQP